MNKLSHHFLLGLSLFIGICCSQVGFAQGKKDIKIEKPTAPTIPQQEDDTFFLHEWHQIYLDKPAQSIKEIYYELDGVPIEGELSNDGRKIFIRNYKGKGRVVVKFNYVNGDPGEIGRSSCHIDPAETS
ncbi:MAG: hypothetical protein ACPGXL_07535 [Chitinophagales bacterium]